MNFGFLGSGFGGMGRGGAEVDYTFVNAEAEAWAAAMTVPPSNARKQAMDTFIGGLKTDSLLTSILAMQIHAAHDHQAARVDVKTPSRVATVAGNGGNGPDFLIDNGFRATSTDDIVDWGIDHAGLGTSLNNHSMMVWSLTDRSGDGRYDLGSASSNTCRINGRTGTHDLLIHGASNLSASYGPAPGNGPAQASLGFYGYSRAASNNLNMVKNGVFVRANINQASTALATGNITTGRAVASTTPNDRRIAAGLVLTHLSEANHLKLYNRLSTYLEAVLGTPPPLA